MKDEIDEWMTKLSQMTKDEADFIECILKWNDEKRISFMLAKRIFEENE